MNYEKIRRQLRARRNSLRPAADLVRAGLCRLGNVEASAVNELNMVREQVKAMQPGQQLAVSPAVLMFRTMPPWNPADMVLDGICGSAYEFYYYRDDRTGNIVFCRKIKPFPPDCGRMSYVSPDRIHYVTKLYEGCYEINAYRQEHVSPPAAPSKHCPGRGR
jgi:hypothetical protein